MQFKLVSRYQPTGDQPQAIEELTAGVFRGDQHQVLLGVTGSGKTFTLANVIARTNRPTLVLSHNKTLAAQLYGEFRNYFPENGVGYFVSYYDYYQPEAYVPQTDTYIEKDASINENIDRLRLEATSLLLSRRDVVIVASVSCIYGLGTPEDFERQMLRLEVGQTIPREEILERLVSIQYQRNDLEFKRGVFRVRGDVIDLYPSHAEEAFRIELFGDEIERIKVLDPVTMQVKREQEGVAAFPTTHFSTPAERLTRAILGIEDELLERLRELESQGKLLEAQRLKMRTRYDLEMLREIGFCAGIENYSRHLAGREPGERPSCLLDYFPRDFLMILDESHVTVPQVNGMYGGDRSRKQNLVEFGFRLPSALDNRPLRFDEFEGMIHQAIYISATPADYELEKARGVVVEQVIRPTGLVDPEVEVRPTTNQIDDLLVEIRRRTARQERVLVTTLTKRMAEDLTDYLVDAGIRVRYIHSDIGAIERMDILRGLRLGKFDVLVGINLLREGLDLPEVSLVAILDADKEGFLRSERSLIQTAGRAARNAMGAVILYADTVTGSMDRALTETRRRRKRQLVYNRENGITPRTVYKSVEEILQATAVADAMRAPEPKPVEVPADPGNLSEDEFVELLIREMKAAAENLEYERAASIRDRILEIKGAILMTGGRSREEPERPGAAELRGSDATVGGRVKNSAARVPDATGATGAVTAIVRLALAEDVGGGDVTTLATVEADRRAVGRIVSRQSGVLSGLAVAREVVLEVDPEVVFETMHADGDRIQPDETIALLLGPARSLLTIERTLLNFLQRLSGVATFTSRFVGAVAGTGVAVADTRKTTPGLRALEKAAVRDGGGVNHRFGLHDACMIKDNHIAAAGGIAAAIARVQARRPELWLTVEARTLAEAGEAARCGSDQILLDNMGPEEIGAAVAAIRTIERGVRSNAPEGDRSAARPAAPAVAGGAGPEGDSGAVEGGPSRSHPIRIEVSGGVTLENIRTRALPGVDWISVGALTHSAPALDIAMELEVVREVS